MVRLRQPILGAVKRYKKYRINRKPWVSKNSRKVILVLTTKKLKEITNWACFERNEIFKKKYPSANLKNFVFDADLTKDGNLIKTFTKYKDEEGVSYEISGYLFKKFYKDKLYWQPRI